VAGSSGDLATPHTDGVRTTAQLRGALLLTVRGYGHTALFNASGRRSVSAYLLRVALPRRRAVCTQDRRPFAR